MYTRLSERLGIVNHLSVLNVMLAKIAVNLKVYGACDDVITPTLALFQVDPETLPLVRVGASALHPSSAPDPVRCCSV